MLILPNQNGIIDTPNPGIVMQTAKGRAIPNDQYRTPIEDILGEHEGLKRQYTGLGFIERRGPTGNYNCHGLTFGARRAFIYDKDFLAHIFSDDGYIKVGIENVLPADVILYISEDGEYTHSGIVVQATGKMQIQVCSKWGFSGEFIHWAHSTPYGNNYEFWRVQR
ncbi:hypothetical protein [Burkholderia gladioli]|uniref:hypothetical protein n=1 Tax=Burkholderia gladioli TaxID=28095 RepID=UPI001641C06D|nr:hypothetical protein [Burkholderia gladioli]